MKNTRKLIPAVAMLMTSAVMMSTASYAWFSMNTKVTASGMNVVATTSKNLVITATTGANYDTTATLTDGKTAALNPVSVNCAQNANLAEKKFYYNDNGIGVNYDNGTFDIATTTFEEVNVADTYYETFLYYVKVDGQSTDTFDNFYVNAITVKDTKGTTTMDDDDTPDAEISKALRVAVTDGAKTFIFAPLNGSYTEGKSISSVDSGTKLATLSDQALATLGTTSTFGEISTTEKALTVYVWYEGNDTACTSANSVSVENLSISIDFQAA